MNAPARVACRIAVIGAGSVGVSFLYQFLRLLQEAGGPAPYAFTLVDPSPRTGSGEPYQPGDPTALLNTRTGTTSAMHTERRHFLDWIERQLGELHADHDDLDPSPDGFVPRSVFGRYLEHVYDESLAIARGLGVAVHRVHRAATAVTPDGGGAMRISTSDGETLTAHRVVLCIGNPPGRLYEELRGTPGYVHTPYPADRALAHVPASARVCVVGSGLTATDTVIALAQRNGVRDIVCVSMNGRVQGVKSAANRQPELAFLTPQRLREMGRKLSLRELADLFVREVEHHTGRPFVLDEVLHPGLSPLAFLERDIDDAQRGAKPWQSVIYALNDVIEEIWQHLSDEGREDFMRRYRVDFMSYKVAIPLRNARILRQLLADGRLRVLRSVTPIRYDAGTRGYACTADDPLTREVFPLEADHVVNATGFSTSYHEPPDPLTRSLIAQGLATPARFGGLEVDFRTSNLVDRRGRIIERISALGTLSCGTYFWTAAMDVNAKLAHRLARRIIDEERSLRP